MLSSLDWLALEVKYLDRAVAFYEEHLGLSVVDERDGEVAFGAGETELRLRQPGAVPRGGLHTHYAFSTPAAEYDAWYDRLSASFDLEEYDFGGAKSLYFYDTEGNCVEIGQSDDDGEGITGVFEVVLEVEDLDRAQAFYEAVGFEVTDPGGRRPRVRLTAGPFDLELWEPQLGLADARGGVHVDVGVGADDPKAVGDQVRDRACAVTDASDEAGGAVRVRDPDGHYLTLR